MISVRFLSSSANFADTAEKWAKLSLRNSKEITKNVTQQITENLASPSRQSFNVDLFILNFLLFFYETLSV